MPGYRVHLVGGGVAALSVLALLMCVGCVSCVGDGAIMISCVCASLAGALFPDIDIKSKGQNYFYWLVFILLIYFYAQQKLERCALLALVCTIPLLTRHRGILHNVWFLTAMIVSCMALVVVHCTRHAPLLCLLLGFFLLGMISHIWLDVGLRRMLRLPRRW